MSGDYGEWGQCSPTLLGIRRTAVKIAARGALPNPSVIGVIVVGHRWLLQKKTSDVV
jgi:hypothetical protein